MKMRFVVSVAMVLVAIANFLILGTASSDTVPAFLWSPHEELYSSNKIKEVVNYQTIAQEDLAKSVLSEGGWSNLLCSEEELHQQPLDLAVVFVGRELHSSDLSRNNHRVQDPSLIDLLEASFTKSNYSISFPYVATSEGQTMESSLISGFTKTCSPRHEMNRIAFTESCSVEEGTEYKKLSSLQSIHDFVSSSVGKSKTAADLLVFCHGDSDDIKKPDVTESEVLTELIRFVDQSGAKYAALYVSDPFRSIQYPSQRDVERFLAESTNGSSVSSTTCDEVCQIKSSLLEALLVAVVLLIILISGLCCMMGIDSPTRFETPQD